MTIVKTRKKRLKKRITKKRLKKRHFRKSKISHIKKSKHRKTKPKKYTRRRKRGGQDVMYVIPGNINSRNANNKSNIRDFNSENANNESEHTKTESEHAETEPENAENEQTSDVILYESNKFNDPEFIPTYNFIPIDNNVDIKYSYVKKKNGRLSGFPDRILYTDNKIITEIYKPIYDITQDQYVNKNLLVNDHLVVISKHIYKQTSISIITSNYGNGELYEKTLDRVTNFMNCMNYTKKNDPTFFDSSLVVFCFQEMDQISITNVKNNLITSTNCLNKYLSDNKELIIEKVELSKLSKIPFIANFKIFTMIFGDSNCHYPKDAINLGNKALQNKGYFAINVNVDNISFYFYNCHLNFKNKVDEYNDIVNVKKNIEKLKEETVKCKNNSSGSSVSEKIFFVIGDLNSRSIEHDTSDNNKKYNTNYITNYKGKMKEVDTCDSGNLKLYCMLHNKNLKHAYNILNPNSKSTEVLQINKLLKNKDLLRVKFKSFIKNHENPDTNQS